MVARPLANTLLLALLVAMPLFALATLWGARPVHLTHLALVCGLLVVGLLLSSTRLLGRLDVERAGFITAKVLGLAGHDDDLREIRRIDLLRIVVGILLTARYLQIAEAALFADAGTARELYVHFALLSTLFCSLSILVGFATPIACLVMLVFADQVFESTLSSVTLGTDVFLMLCIVLAFLPAGTTLSLDSWLVRNSAFWRRLLLPLYRIFGLPSAKRSALLRVFALLSYASVCLYSATWHLDDPAWMMGYANLQALTSSVLSPHYQLFRDFYNAQPELFVLISQVSIYGMLIWESFMLPLLLFRPTRILVIVWGLLFFLASLIILDLSYLPHFEFTLWAMLFWQGWRLNVHGRDELQVFFDDRCNLCDRTLRTLRLLDVFGVIRPKPLSQAGAELERLGISLEQGLSDLHGYTPGSGRLVAGYDFYLTVCGRLLLLVPIWPVLLLFRLLRLGPAVYRAIADRRRQLFGVCELSRVPTAPLAAGPFAEGTLDRRQNTSLALLVTYLVFFVNFHLMWLPLTHRFLNLGHNDRGTVQQVTSRLLFAGGALGLSRINVFNEEDLLMDHHFVVASYVDRDGRRHLLDYHGHQGERLGADRSDRILYGVTAGWRRSMKSDDPVCYEPPEGKPTRRQRVAARSMDTLIRYYRGRHGVEAETFRFDYYFTEPWDYGEIAQAKEKDFAARHLCTVLVDPQTFGKTVLPAGAGAAATK